MPANGNEIIIRIQPDGTILDQYGHHLVITAVPVPSHGRLGDLDELYSRLERWYQTYERAFSESEVIYIRAVLAGVKETPTIIPAEEEAND